jgi:hypothetical protein
VRKKREVVGLEKKRQGVLWRRLGSRDQDERTGFGLAGVERVLVATAAVMRPV